MRAATLLISSFLAASVAGSPTGPSCNADNCLRAVRASSHAPYPATGTADCSSFLRKTVTPCPVTSTTTQTVTAAPTTVTLTDVENVSQTITSTEAVTSVTTIEATATIVMPRESVVTETSVAVVTQTVAFFKKSAPATTTSSATAGTCAATTNPPTKVPTYASACSGTVRYSSACSCAGVTGSTTTLTASTVVSTTTSTVTPTATAIATVVATSSVTHVVTTVVPATFTTTDATVIIPSAYTSTAEVVVTSTVLVSPPQPTCFTFVSTTDPNNFVGGSGDYSILQLVDATGADIYTIRPDGTVYDQNGYGWIVPGPTATSHQDIQLLDDNTFKNVNVMTHNGYNRMQCTIGNGDTSYANAVGSLQCTDGGQPVFLVYCSGSGRVQRSIDADGGGGCTDLKFVAIPAAS